jgi:hypothetical protein
MPQLLRLAERGPQSVADAFPRMHDDETVYYITDGSLAEHVATLSSLRCSRSSVKPIPIPGRYSGRFV